MYNYVFNDIVDIPPGAPLSVLPARVDEVDGLLSDFCPKLAGDPARVDLAPYLPELLADSRSQNGSFGPVAR